MLARHVKVAGSQIRFRFRGKSGKDHTILVSDRRMARLVRQCQELPGQTLFQYLDEHESVHAIDASDVNAYLHRIAGNGFTAKDFRTWGGTLLAASHLAPDSNASSGDPSPALKAVIRDVADALGNTAAVCRKCYIHPLILGVFNEAEARARWDENWKRARPSEGLTREESALIHFLEGGA
jgi:DNA topoisomerase-1